jgi:hypothetical protein
LTKRTITSSTHAPMKTVDCCVNEASADMDSYQGQQIAGDHRPNDADSAPSKFLTFKSSNWVLDPDS